MQYLKIILDALIPTLAPIIASGLGLIGIWALHKLSQKFGVQASAAQDQMVFDAAHSAVDYAEAWAAKQVKTDPATLVDGPAKLAKAMEFLKGQLETRNAAAYGDEQLTRILESALQVKKPVKV